MDRWPSGRRRTIGNRVYLQRVSRVRIPVYPPFTTKPRLVWGFGVNTRESWGLNHGRKGFENKVQADGSMPVSEAKNRCFDEVNPCLSANKNNTLSGIVFYLQDGDSKKPITRITKKDFLKKGSLLLNWSG